MSSNDAVLELPAAELMETPATPAAKEMTGRFVFTLTVLLGCFAGLGPLAIDMYLPSFPQIADRFGATLPQVERTLTAYLFGLAFGQLFYGPAADRWGRKPPLYVGLVLFILASIACTFATGVHGLIAARIAQALGGCAEMVIARAVVRDLFDERRAVSVFSSLILVMGVAPILAPLLGGWVAIHFGWQGVFWALAIAGAICLVGAATLLPESLPPERRQRRSILATFFLYRGLLTHRVFMVNTLTISLACAALFAYVGGSPALFMGTYHVAPQHFGLFFGANAFALISMSQVNGRLAKNLDPRKVLRVALTVATITSAVLLATVLTGVGGLAAVTVCLFVFMGTFGFIFPNSTVLAMQPHGAHAGGASAMLGCLQFLVSAIAGLVVTNLPLSGPVAMAVVMAGCMALVAVMRTVMRL